MTPAYGAPDGHGRYGIIDTDDDGLLICHDCGQGWRHLATHARMAHGYADAASYREAHGLGLRTRLVAPETSARMSERWEGSRPTREARLAEVRDPQRASRASLGRPMRPGAVAGRMHAAESRRRDLTGDQVAALGDWYDIPGWAARARRLMAGTGLGSRAIARALGVSQGAVDGRLKRYPGNDE